MADPNDPSGDQTAVAEPGTPTLRLPGIELTVVEGATRGESVKAKRGIISIGTASDNDLLLKDKAVSRCHAELRLRNDAVRVVDLGSTNGTFVDGVRIVEAILSPASRIEVGSTVLRVSALDELVTVPLSTRTSFGGLIGGSVAMRELFAILERVAPTDATVVLEGETGTGKELAAEALHAQSTRAEGPFVAVDCGAIPANLIESELFGHMRGAFTGAVDNRIGVFQEADGGTLFLDEIGELPIELQPKLLRALEKREIRPLGESRPRAIDVRVVAATNRSLAVEVNRGIFREDLFFRLAVVQAKLPPLRARPEDIGPLVHHFVELLSPSRKAEAIQLAESLVGRAFRGNVRELRNTVERSLALSEPGSLGDASADDSALDFAGYLRMPYRQAYDEIVTRFERAYVEHALRVSGGSVTGAAKQSGMSRRYVQKLMARHKIER